jgi:hypothetical protein
MDVYFIITQNNEQQTAKCPYLTVGHKHKIYKHVILQLKPLTLYHLAEQYIQF